MANVGSGLTWTFFENKWHKGNPPLLGARSHGLWLSSSVFDGARAFNGHIPDLEPHCARVIRSARLLGMAPMLTTEEIMDLCWEGVDKFPADRALYVCPMFYAEDGFIIPDSASTRFVLTIFDAPLPEPTGFTACKSSFRRPARDMAPTDAKASCLYPNVSRCVQEAKDKGFDTAVVLDPTNNVAEFAYTNLFYVKDQVLYTPQINGTFLNGITRQRIIKLAKADGIEVIEKAVQFPELFEADEIFGTGNYSKLSPLVQLEDRHFKIGKVSLHLHDLYFDWAKK